MAKTEVTSERLHELLSYDPSTGSLTAKIRRGNIAAGDTLGCMRSDGYIQLGIDGAYYQAHRVIWKMMTGDWPDEIDHVDANRANNVWKNLRDVDVQTNRENQTRARPNSRSGLLGTAWDAARGKWIAGVMFRRKRYYVGAFDTAQEAHLAYVETKRQLHQGCTI